jgi:hypothetical protein
MRGVRHIRRADAFLLVAGPVWLCALQPDQKHAGQRHADASPRLRAARLGTQCTTRQVPSELPRLEDDLAAARSRLPRAAQSPWRRSLPSGRWSSRQRSAPRARLPGSATGRAGRSMEPAGASAGIPAGGRSAGAPTAAVSRTASASSAVPGTSPGSAPGSGPLRGQPGGGGGDRRVGHGEGAACRVDSGAEAVEEFLLDGLGVPGEAAGGRDQVQPLVPGVGPLPVRQPFPSDLSDGARLVVQVSPDGLLTAQRRW